MDPIIAAIVTAVALGASSGLQSAASTAVGDAYAGLKRLILGDRGADDKLSKALVEVEQDPADTALRNLLATRLADAGLAEDAGLGAAARSFLDAVLAEPAAADAARQAGFQIETLRAAALDVTASSVRIDNAEINGTATFRIGGS
jgi:hypothetical protein